GGTNNNPRSLLIFNSFRDHLVNNVKNRFDEKQTNIVIIPEGLTGRLQLLDMRINKIFKSKTKALAQTDQFYTIYPDIKEYKFSNNNGKVEIVGKDGTAFSGGGNRYVSAFTSQENSVP
ncbi:15757_t:CDS:2, partial [Funneliformis geosporum]